MASLHDPRLVGDIKKKLRPSNNNLSAKRRSKIVVIIWYDNRKNRRCKTIEI